MHKHEHVATMYFSLVEILSKQSAAVIVMTAYGHNLKEITRGQLQSAARHLSPAAQKKLVGKADKKQLLLPLPNYLVDEGIIKIKDGACISELTCDDVTKEKTF